MNKKDLRSKYKTIRQNIKSRYIKDLYIYFKIINNKKVKESNTIFIYVSKEDEVDTFRIIKHFLKRKKVCVPKVIGNEIIFFYIESFKDLEKGNFDVLEPTTNNKINNFSSSCIIVPGICFDKRGYRIGYGKGFYDRFLSKHNIYSIGLTYKECIVDNINNDKHDINVNIIISDSITI